jgi:ubiquinone/menaquinone biosynthesis C-methylase UbiE
MKKLSTAEANRRFYAEIAETYHRIEDCVASPRHRRRLRETLEGVVAQLPAAPRALDACGGSGNVSLLLLEMGVRPTTVDVSPEMLTIYKREARTHGFETDTCIAEIVSFLREDERIWDLIVFSSALHHLEDYETAIDLAVNRLAPGGFVVTIFDPTQAGRLGRIIRWFDYVLHVMVKTPRRIPGLVARVLTGRRFRDRGGGIGAQAERYAVCGIDDQSLANRLRRNGLDVVAHKRLYEGRFAVTRILVRLIGSPSSFSLVARRRRGPR